MFLNFMCNRKTCFAVVLVLVTGVFAWIASQDGSPNPLPQSVSSQNKHSSAGLHNPGNLEKSEIKLMPQPSLSQSPLPQPPLEASIKSTAPEAWLIGKAAGATPSIPLPARVTEYEPVRVDMEHPSYPEPGARVTVAVPGNESFRVNVEQSVINPNGDYTWRGHVEGYGNDYPVIMTYGQNSAFATITTPKGSYTLETLNGSGWVYKNLSEFELSEHGKNDYLDPPRQ